MPKAFKYVVYFYEDEKHEHLINTKNYATLKEKILISFQPYSNAC